MKKLALVGAVVSAIAFAADKPAMDAKAMGGMMEGWTPRKVTKEDKKAVTDTLEAMHNKMMAGGTMDDMMAGMDFPVIMMTDDKDGNVMMTTVDAAQYKKMMEPSMKAMAENKEMHDQMAKMPKPKMDVFFVTDSMALVDAKMMMPMGKDKMEVRNNHIMVLKDGKWMVKGMIEGGWGDMAKKQMEEMKKAEMAKPGTEMKPAANAQPMKK